MLVRTYATLNSHRSAPYVVRKFSSPIPAHRRFVITVIHCGNFRSGFVSCGEHSALRSEVWRAGAARSPESRCAVGPVTMRRNECRGGRNPVGDNNGDCAMARISVGDGIAKAGSGDVVRQGWVQLSERVTLRPGDKVRVSGGPYWEQPSPDGGVTKTRLGERGVMVFEEYCQLGQSRWIVARGRNGYAALHLGPEEHSAEVPGLVRRPYRLRRIRSAQPRRNPTLESVRSCAKNRGRRLAAHRKARP